MPELPEVEALAEHLRSHALGRTVHRLDVASLAVLKTFDPPVSALQGRELTAVQRYGKFLAMDHAGLWLVVHLARAGWLRWAQTLAATPPRPGGKSPLALRVHLGPAGSGPGFDLTEAGTKKGLAVWVVDEVQQIPALARLGPDALAMSHAELVHLLAGRTSRLKTILTEQVSVAGIGNAYSDEILHTARLSPFATAAKLDAPAVQRLHDAIQSVLSDAVQRSVGQQAALLKAEKRSGLRVHARTGLACPVCGDLIAEVSFTDKAFQYCPTCQTGGKPLADRRMSRLLK